VTYLPTVGPAGTVYATGSHDFTTVKFQHLLTVYVPKVMATREEQLKHVERLADELKQRGFTIELVGAISKPYLRVANAETPTLNERVLCHQADDNSWVFWWPWKQPIGSVDNLALVVGKIAAVLRSVEGA
jgi:hypothetical protein